jgi:hypothetical protein
MVGCRLFACTDSYAHDLLDQGVGDYRCNRLSTVHVANKQSNKWSGISSMEHHRPTPDSEREGTA